MNRLEDRILRALRAEKALYLPELPEVPIRHLTGDIIDLEGELRRLHESDHILVVERTSDADAFFIMSEHVTSRVFDALRAAGLKV